MPVKKKYHVLGELHFHNISDEDLKTFAECVERLSFEYDADQRYDVSSVLKSVHKDLSNELCDRLVDTTVVCKTHKVPKLKSPAKRCLTSK